MPIENRISATESGLIEKKFVEKQKEVQADQIDDYAAKCIDSLGEIIGMGERMENQIKKLRETFHAAKTIEEKQEIAVRLKNFKAVLETLKKINEERFEAVSANIGEKIEEVNAKDVQKTSLN